MNVRKRTFAQWLAAFFMLLSTVAVANMEDMVLRFSTSGTDRYADGSVVLDGECYALVWSPKGTAFSGFNADGTAVSANDRIVLAAPLAKEGKCRDAIFQIPAADYAELDGGEWAVCLVDTRMANGVPAGSMDNLPLRVNRWGAVRSDVKVEPASASSLRLAAPKSASRLMSAAGSGNGARAGILSAVPASVKPPQITGIDVSEGVIRLSVADTVPFLSYTIVSGGEPSALKTDYAADVVDGDQGAEIEIGTVQSIGRNFFKVMRAE